MIAFKVNDMTCGHCVSTITQAVKSLDPGAKVEIDLATHRVRIEPGVADAQELSDAIAQAGYTPVPDPASAASGPSTRRGGCGCGCA